MDKLLKSSREEFEKSSYLMELIKHPSGECYVKLEHFIKASNSRNSVFISADNLSKVIEMFHYFNDEIKFSERKEWMKIRNLDDERLIVSFFLKGVTIKDLSLTYRYDESVIVDVLVKNEITIVDGIDLPTNHYYFSTKKKYPGRRK